MVRRRRRASDRPQYERSGNYVPTVLPRRYDPFLYVHQTTAVGPLFRPTAAELPEEALETYPTGVQEVDRVLP